MLIRSKSQSELRDASLWIRTGAILLGAALLGLWGTGFPDSFWSPKDWRELAGVCLVSLGAIGLGLLGMGWATHMEDSEARSFAGGTIINPSSQFIAGLTFFALVGVVLLLRCGWVAVGLTYDAYDARIHRGDPDPGEVLDRFGEYVTTGRWTEATALLSEKGHERLEVENKTLAASLLGKFSNARVIAVNWSDSQWGKDLRKAVRRGKSEPWVNWVCTVSNPAGDGPHNPPAQPRVTSVIRLFRQNDLWLIDGWDGRRPELDAAVESLVDAIRSSDPARVASHFSPMVLDQLKSTDLPLPASLAGRYHGKFAADPKFSTSWTSYGARHPWAHEPEVELEFTYWLKDKAIMGTSTKLRLRFTQVDGRWIVVAWHRAGADREPAGVSSRP